MAKVPNWKISFTNRLYDIYLGKKQNGNISDLEAELLHLGLCILAVDGTYIRNAMAYTLGKQGKYLLTELCSDTRELMEHDKCFISEKIDAEELYNHFEKYQTAVMDYTMEFVTLVTDTISRYKKEKGTDLIFFLLDRKNGIGLVLKDYICRKKYPSLYQEAWVMDLDTSERAGKEYVNGRMVKSENMLRIINKYTDEISWFTDGHIFINPNKQKEKARCIFEKLFPIQYQNFECTHCIKDLHIILEVLIRFHSRTDSERVKTIVSVIWNSKQEVGRIVLKDENEETEKYMAIVSVFENYMEELENLEERFILQHYSEDYNVYFGKEKYSYDKIFFYWKKKKEKKDSNYSVMTAKEIAGFLRGNWNEQGVKLRFKRLLQQFNYRVSMVNFGTSE